MRVLETLIAARQARMALERVLAVNDWPADRALSLAIDRLVVIEEQSAVAIRRATDVLGCEPLNGSR